MYVYMYIYIYIYTFIYIGLRALRGPTARRLRPFRVEANKQPNKLLANSQQTSC